MNYYRFITIVLIAAIMHCCTTARAQQGNAQAFTAADTSYFSVTNTNGWLLYNSYGSYNNVTDSVTLEIILQHANNLNLTEYQYIGKIKENLLKPSGERVLFINLITAIYKVKVKEDGKCYLAFVSGTLPQGTDIIVQVKAVYKK